jgi:hypothetical protein
VRSDDGEISRLDGSVSRRRRITVVTIAVSKRSNTVGVQSDQTFWGAASRCCRDIDAAVRLCRATALTLAETWARPCSRPSPALPSLCGVRVFRGAATNQQSWTPPPPPRKAYAAQRERPEKFDCEPAISTRSRESVRIEILFAGAKLGHGHNYGPANGGPQPSLSPPRRRQFSFANSATVLAANRCCRSIWT